MPGANERVMRTRPAFYQGTDLSCLCNNHKNINGFSCIKDPREEIPYLPVPFSPSVEKPFSRFSPVKPIAKDVISEEIFCQAEKDLLNFKSPESNNNENCV